jgi:hypothetical protein
LYNFHSCKSCGDYSSKKSHRLDRSLHRLSWLVRHGQAPSTGAPFVLGWCAYPTPLLPVAAAVTPPHGMWTDLLKFHPPATHSGWLNFWTETFVLMLRSKWTGPSTAKAEPSL